MSSALSSQVDLETKENIKDLKIQNEQILEMVTNQKSLIYLLMIFILLQGLFMMYNSMTQSNLAYQVSQMNNNMLKIQQQIYRRDFI